MVHSSGERGIRSPVAYILYAPSDPPAPSFGGVLPPLPPVGRRRLRFESLTFPRHGTFQRRERDSVSSRVHPVRSFRPACAFFRRRPAASSSRWSAKASVRVPHFSPSRYIPAEREGFEPSEPLRVQRFSRPSDSTALASLQ